MSKAKIQKMINNAPPSWLEMFKRYKLGRKPTVDRLINTVLEHTPTMASSGERGAAKYKVPAKVRKEAMKGLELSWRHNYTSASGIGLVRAMQLVVKPKIWERSVHRMKAYFTRHEVDKQGEHFGDDRKPSRGYMAWLVWGGDSGFAWSKKMVGSKQNPRVSKHSLTNPSWKSKRPTTNYAKLKPNQKVIMYHATSLTDAMEMVYGFDTNKMVRSKYHSRGYSYRGMYVSPRPLGSFGYVIFKLALRTNNLHGTDWSANITRPSDPQYDKKESRYRKKWSKEMYPDSFRPDLSRTLLQKTEPQALYRGIVSPDMILGIKVSNEDWMSREEFIRAYDADDINDGFDVSSPNYTIDEYLDFIGGGRDERERIIATVHRKMRYDRDPDRRNDNVERMLNSLGFGVSAQKAFLRKFKRKYGTEPKKNPRRRRNSAYEQRAINAGADPSTLEIIGEGGEGVVFTDRTGKVFKVGKKDLYNEAVALSVLAQYDYAPQFYGYDNNNNVIVRDYAKGRVGRWGDDLWDHYQTIGKILTENDLTRPEYKEESFVILPDGRVHMYDVGFVHLLGKRLVDDLKRKDPSRITDSMEAFDYESDVIAAVNDGYLTKKQGREMLSRLANEHWRNAGLDILSNPRRRRNRDTSNIRMPSSWDLPFREGSVVQTIMFSTKHFDGRQARAWLHKHGFKAPKMDKTANYMRYRQFDPKMFNKDSFRTLEFKKGLLAVVGIPKQKFVKNPKRRRNRWEKDSLGHRGAACKRWEREGTAGCPKGSSRDALVRYRATPRGQAAQERLFERIRRSTKGYLEKPVVTQSGTVTTYYYIVGTRNGKDYLKRVTKEVAESVRK